MEYLEREFKEWDKITPVYSEKLDQYFFTVDELSDYCYDAEITDEDGTFLKLLICEPIYLWQLDFNNIYCDILPEDFNIDDVASKELLVAMTNFNNMIKDHKSVSWFPGKFRTI
jgi:hypothetical protein